MKVIDKISYIMVSVLILIKIIDIVITMISLPLGAIELNPLGFNAISIICSFLVVIILILALKISNMSNFVLGITIFFNSIGIYILINNILGLSQFLGL